MNNLTRVPRRGTASVPGLSQILAPRSSTIRRVIGLAVIIALVVVPLIMSTYAVITLTQILVLALLVMSLVLLMGHGGMVSLGQAGFFGVGGYTAGLLVGVVTDNALVMVAMAAIIGSLTAGAVGWLLLRARSAYFLMLTLAIGEILTLIAVAWVSVTGGSDGLANIPNLKLIPGVDLRHPAFVYWFVGAVVLVAALLIALLLSSPFGAALRGIRENESRMRALGYSTAFYKYAAICISGGLAGLAGALSVIESNFIAPSDMGFHASAFALLALIVGGSTSLWGAVLGAAVIVAVQNLLPLALQGAGPLILGATLIVAVYLLPTGIAGLAARFAKLRRRQL